MINTILFVFLFFLPAGIANMAPVLASKMPFFREWNYPVDGNLTWGGKRLLGDNKTVRGFVVGIFLAILTTEIIFQLIPIISKFGSIFPDNYFIANPFFLGLLLGLGALAGDSVKSFFKRRLNIASGKSWFPFDQLDYIIGIIVFTAFYVPLSPVQYLLLVALGFILHIATVYIGYLTHLRDKAI